MTHKRGGREDWETHFQLTSAILVADRVAMAGIDAFTSWMSSSSVVRWEHMEGRVCK